MYINQKKEEKMAFARAREGNKEMNIMPGQGRGEGTFKRFPSAALPARDILHGLLPPKNTGKPRLDSSHLVKPGSPKFSQFMDLPDFEPSVSAGSPSAVEDPFTRHL
jgi:hypothetical protein